ncbi:MAG TPA: molybdopterin molybdotransferase MoeA [Gammaproteobacteria bacterium]|nr:molybdopterin molybdotransferase MoeA [Gammaproteobacteria bacterium]
MTEVHEAEALILERAPRARTRREPLEAAVGRVLAEPVFAERDQPPFDRVTMDGIAVAFSDWTAGMRRFEIAGTQAAGAAPLAVEQLGRCIEVMTGAMLPPGTDTIIPVERIRRDGDAAEVQADAPVAARQFVHARGSDRTAGSPLLAPGTRIGPAEMAVLASAGAAEVLLAEPPRVAVISTGDELVDVGEPLEPYQIRSSNERAIEASLLGHGLGTVTRARLADDEHLLLDAIGRLHAQHDVLILSGGVSMGQFDYVPAVLERLGVELVFHKIQQRPGRPMWFGVTAQDKLVFALPGNPVSALVCLTRYVLPALRRSLGLPPAAPELAALTAEVELTADLTYFMPVALRSSARGVLEAQPRPTNTSGDFISLAGTDGLVELPRARRRYEPGDVVRLFRW